MSDRDPLIARSEEAEEADAERAANVFDVRRIIGGLFLLYGVILTVLGITASDEDIAQAAGININLWAGLGILVVGGLFMAWALLRPLGRELQEARGRPGGDGERAGGDPDAGRQQP